MSKLRKLALNSMLWAGAQQAGTVITNFVVGVILARLLDPSVFGVVAMIALFRSIGNVLVDSGMGSSLVRSEKVDDKDYSTVFVMNMAISLLLYGLIYISAPLIADFFETPILVPVMRVLCLTFVIRAISLVHNAKLSKDLNFKRIFIIQFPSLLLSGLLGIYLALNGFEVWSLVYMHLTQSILYSTMLIAYSRWFPKLQFMASRFKPHFQYGYKLTLSSVIGTLFDNLYVIVIGKFFSSTQLGFYNRANNLKQLPISTITDILTRVTFPLFAKIQNDKVKLKDAYRRLIQLVFFALIPLIVIMGVLAEPLFRFLLTEKWLPAVPYFKVMCITAVLFPLHSYNLNVLKVLGRTDLFLRLELIKRGLVVVAVVVTLQYGVMGLLYGQIVVNLIALYLNTYYSGEMINYTLWQQLKDNLKLLIIGLILLVTTFGIYRFSIQYIEQDLYVLLADGLLALLIYFALSKLLKLEQLDELNRLIKFRS